MKPNRGEGISGSELQPAVAVEVNEIPEDNKSEQTIVSPESSPSKQMAPLIPPPTVQLPADYSAPAVPADDDNDHQALSSRSDKSDKGTDRIEKRWVDSAKNIINQTKDDPYKQKNEMSKVKADYIKQRFNKVVKADQETS
jgi:hypothetical protein